MLYLCELSDMYVSLKAATCIHHTAINFDEIVEWTTLTLCYF